MNSEYYEENVKMNDNALKKRKFLSRLYLILMIISITLFGLFIALAFFMPNNEDISQEANAIGYFTFLAIAVIFMIPFFLFMALRLKVFYEYDYTFLSGTVKVAKVFSRGGRKGIFSFDCDDIVLVGKVDDADCKKYEDMKDIKFYLGTPNLDVEGHDCYYVIVHNQGGRHMLYFEPSVRFLTDMRKSAGRNIFEVKA